MASISRQGIYADCKQLMELTYQLTTAMTNKDRIAIGDKLMAANVSMIEAFSMAYTRADEKITYDDGAEFFYDVIIKGCKRSEIDRLQGCYMYYRALWEFAFKLDLHRWSIAQQQQKQAEFVRLLTKIETGINKWKSGTPRQVVVSKNRHNSDQTL